jgi:hypothetical protein
MLGRWLETVCSMFEKPILIGIRREGSTLILTDATDHRFEPDDLAEAMAHLVDLFTTDSLDLVLTFRGGYAITVTEGTPGYFMVVDWLNDHALVDNSSWYSDTIFPAFNEKKTIVFRRHEKSSVEDVETKSSTPGAHHGFQGKQRSAD